MTDLFSLSSYQFSLPEELIAKHPCDPRDHSRLMLVNRESGEITEIPFHELARWLNSGDRLVFNDAKVVPARLIGRRSTGAAVEILLVRRRVDGLWEVIGRPGRKLEVGVRVSFGAGLECEIVDVLEDGQRVVRLLWEGDLEEQLRIYGELPLPLYIKRPFDRSRDSSDYQTIFARSAGAVAAPTAALHFTEPLLAALRSRGVDWTTVTLDVSLGTFKPVQMDDIRLHPMHKERFHIGPEAAKQLRNRPEAIRQVCVGTTCCRLLETACASGFPVGDQETNIFIYPGYRFRYVNTLLTNFHTPGSTLLMLVSAFGGYELIQEAYAKAIERRFRFYSYGDAMLIY